jgi:hypothetical protein
VLSEELLTCTSEEQERESPKKYPKTCEKMFNDKFETLFKIFLEFITSSPLPNIAFLHEQLGESQDFRAHYDIPLWKKQIK